MKRKYTIEQLKEAVASSYSVAETLRKVGIKPYAGYYHTFYKTVEENSIDISHFDKNYRSNETHFREAIPLEDFLSNKHYIKTTALKEKLIKAGIKKNKCEKCGISSWQGKPIKCQLHHIDGNNKNNNLNNLQILCPNCHTQTDNYSNRKHIEVIALASNGYRITPKNLEAWKKSRKSKRPSYEQFKKEFEELNHNFVAMGKKYGVTDNAIRKWIKSYEKYGDT